MGEQLKVNNHLSFGVTSFYKKDKQWIIGVTLNKEQEVYSDNYDEAPYRVQNKYEFNLWLIFIGLHMSIRGRSKQI